MRDSSAFLLSPGRVSCILCKGSYSLEPPIPRRRFLYKASGSFIDPSASRLVDFYDIVKRKLAGDDGAKPGVVVPGVENLKRKVDVCAGDLVGSAATVRFPEVIDVKDRDRFELCDPVSVPLPIRDARFQGSGLIAPKHIDRSDTLLDELAADRRTDVRFPAAGSPAYEEPAGRGFYEVESGLLDGAAFRVRGLVVVQAVAGKHVRHAAAADRPEGSAGVHAFALPRREIYSVSGDQIPFVSAQRAINTAKVEIFQGLNRNGWRFLLSLAEYCANAGFVHRLSSPR